MVASLYRILLVLMVVACLGVSALWCRSYWILDRYSYETDLDYNRKVRSDIGRLSYFRVTSDNHYRDAASLVSMTIIGDDVPSSVPLLENGGFNYEYGQYGNPGDPGAFTRLHVTVPYWAVVAALGILPVTAANSALKRRKRPAPAEPPPAADPVTP